MKSKTDLYQLIRAMSKSEKRYFTLDAQKSGRRASKYLELFQEINDMAEYDEERLKEKFGRHLSSDKAYLYEAILRSMRDYRSTRSHSARIKEMILDAKYLYERGLYEQCEERLEEAKKLALELDDQLALLEINRENRTLAFNTRKNYDIKIKDLILEKESNIESLVEEFRYLDAGYELLLEWKKNTAPGDLSRLDRLKKLFPFDLLDETIEPGSQYARRLYYQCAAMYAQLMGRPDLVASYYGRAVEWWDINPKYKNEEFSRYIADISNLLHAYASQGRYESLPGLLDRLEDDEIHNYHEKAVVFQRASIYRLMYYINTGEQEGIQPFINRIEKGLSQYKIEVVPKMVLLFNVAVLLFINENFTGCRQWCKKIRELKSDMRQDIQRGAYLINLIASFEVLEPEDFDRVLRGTQRMLRIFKIPKEKFDWEVFEYFKRLSFATISEQKRILGEMKNRLAELRSSEARISLGLDELVLWYTESKQEKKPMLRIIRELQRQQKSVR